MRERRALLLLVLLMGVLWQGKAQNLLQNPGFESAARWDEFWILSPSATAVAAANTDDAHEGIKSVELSNTKANQWTYFYSDSENAPLRFKANERYLVRAWIKILEEGKAVSLSLFWNNSLDQLIFYEGNPDPVTNPDWFMVVDTLNAMADFTDGYLNLGLRAGKLNNEVAGKLLVDDLSVTRLPSRETELLSFSMEEQTQAASIDALLHAVSLEVPYSTDVSALVPSLELSLGASSVPGSGEPVDFTTPVVYQVIAEDGITTQDWTVTVNKAAPSKETAILSFSVAEQTGPATIDNVYHTVIVEVAYGTDLSSINPIIGLSPGATIDPQSGIQKSFSSPSIYTVTAEDGITTQEYIIVIMTSSISNETDISSFYLKEQSAPAVIDYSMHTVAVYVPYGTDVTGLAPSIQLSAGATIDPASGVSVDFTGPVSYRVTAEDGVTVQDWTVHLNLLRNDQTEILSFSLAEEVGPADIEPLFHTVSIEVPYGTDLTALVPTIKLSKGATISPGSGVPADFTNPLLYRVTAEDGLTTQEWTVQVRVLPNDQTEILSFQLAEEVASARIDKLLHKISLDVPSGTKLSSLVPSIQVSEGATIDPGSGVPADFTNPVTYKVTAEDGVNTQKWVVTVVILPKNQANILTFSLAKEASPAVIDRLSHKVSIEVLHGTDVTSLVPSIQLSTGATINPGSGVSVDFSSPVVYKVTAEDGVTVQDWTITVIVLANDQADILSFSLAEETGPALIDPVLNTISLQVSSETDLSALIPSIELSAGASIDPGSGLAQDFTEPLEYIVTAEDGLIMKSWIVSVEVAEVLTGFHSESRSGIRIFPNPARDFIHIELSEKGDVALLDMSGRKLKSIRGVSDKLLLPVGELDRGTYLILVTRKGSSQVSKVILD